MPKRRSDWPSVGRRAKRQRQRRRLYFVVDDGDGYAIRKVDLSSDYDSDDDAAQHEDGITEVLLPLPRPLIRLHGAIAADYFAASGTKILVTGCHWLGSIAPAFDVLTRSLSRGPWLQRSSHFPRYMPVGRGLVSLDSGSSANFLDPPPPEHSNFDWSWQNLKKAPFRHHDVTCYASHPDKRTLFISTVSKGGEATFSLDTEDGVWKQHGEWTLPFKGQAYFDPALNAWVGLSGAKQYLGYICSCDVLSIDDADHGSSDIQSMVSVDSNVVPMDRHTGSKQVQPTASNGESTDDDSSGDMPPRWRLGKEQMFMDDGEEKHHGATLVYMGGRSKYCLLQCFSLLDERCVDSDDEDDLYNIDVREEDLPRRYLLRLTTFTLKYDKKGELSIARRRRVRCYELLPDAYPDYHDIRAFLM